MIKKSSYVDIFKGVFFLLVLMGDVGFGSRFELLIHAFTIPMYFFIFGVIYSRENRDNMSGWPMVLTALKIFIVPYLCFGLVGYLLWLLNNWWVINIWQPLYELAGICNNFVEGNIWILTALYFTTCIYVCIDQSLVSLKWKTLVVILFSLLGCVVVNIIPVQIPLSFSQSFAGLGFFYIGVLIGKMEKQPFSKYILHSRLWTLVFMIIFALGFTKLNSPIDFKTEQYGNILLFWVDALLYIFVILNICVRMSMSNYRPVYIINKIAAAIGKHSIVFLCIDIFLIRMFMRFIPLSLSDSRAEVFLCKITVFICTVFVLLALATLMDKFSLSCIFIRRTYQEIILSVGILCIVLGVAVSSAKYARNYYYSDVFFQSETEDVPLIAFDETVSTSIGIEIIDAYSANIDYLLNDYWNSDSIYAYDSHTHTEFVGDINPRQEANIKKVSKSFQSYQDGELDIRLFIGETAGENAIRPWSQVAYCFATASLLDRQNKGECIEKAGKLIYALARSHYSNAYNGWGNEWQSALWAENVGLSAWMIWDSLSLECKYYVANMVKTEANRFIDYEIPYYRNQDHKIVSPTDTHAEDNAWNSKILALAHCMFPNDENAVLWKDMMNKLLISASSCPEDVNSEDVVEGYVLSDVLEGSNINEDGTLINHNLCHVDYMAVTLEGMIETAIIYKLSGRDVPQSCLHNLDLIYSAFTKVDFGKFDSSLSGQHFYKYSDGIPDYMVSMPEMNDWGVCGMQAIICQMS